MFEGIRFFDILALTIITVAIVGFICDKKNKNKPRRKR